jgi:uncharacterized lipoprotein YajG
MMERFFDRASPGDQRLLILIILIISMLLAGCGSASQQVVTATLPELPRVDPKLMERPKNPNCVKDKRKRVPVTVVVSERDCYKTDDLKNQAQLIALQDSVTSIDQSVEKLRTQHSPPTTK